MYRPYTVRPCSLVRERGTKIIVITCDKPSTVIIMTAAIIIITISVF